MSEMILPGTYVTIRDEGLITAGRVVTGNIGIVGTASSVATNKCFILGSFAEAQEIFMKKQENPTSEKTKEELKLEKQKDADAEAPCTLVNALKVIFNNGGQTVYAVQAKGNSATHYEEALKLLENELVNIVLLAGQDATNADMVTALTGHIKSTAKIKRERIGIMGCGADMVAVPGLVSDDGRIIYVGPGFSATETGASTAAAVAGLLSSLPVQTSPTNKTLVIKDLVAYYSTSKLVNLLQQNFLVVERRNGFRIVKGITTSTNTAWHQITTRRIVDYATYGVRSACDPYIGKLNNDRVRGAMKATIDGFLTRMVEDEALVSYTLEVTATRSQEIAGEVRVTMTIQPTFSIDFIVVTMYLG